MRETVLQLDIICHQVKDILCQSGVGYILLSHWPKRSHRPVPHPHPPKNSQIIVQTVDYSLYPDGWALLLKTTYVIKRVNRGGAQLEASPLPLVFMVQESTLHCP